MDIQEFEQRLHDAEVRLARLKALYEQWFQGIERVEPTVARKELDRALEALRREQPRNTALRFRFQQLTARYGTYGIYWSRVAKQIEDGTYRRELQRIRDRQQRQSRGAAQAIELDVDIDELDSFGDSDLDAILGALSEPTPGSEGKRAEPTTEPAPPPDAPQTQPAPPPSVAVPRVGGPVPPARPPIPGATASIPAPAGASVRPPPVPAPNGAPAAFAGPVTGAPRVPAPPPRPSQGPLAIGRMARPASTPPTGGVREEAGSHSRAARPGTPATGAPRPAEVRPAEARPAPSAAPPSGTGLDIRALYERYIDARRRNNERTDNVRFETLQQSVEKMIPKLREKHAGKVIDFDVVVQDGKVGLKPRVRG
ncbi:MAG: hypothetical protein OHK0013_31510 [Sandaracinaceae bacterium]